MRKSLIIILSMFILNVGCSQTTKNQDTKFIEFVNSFEEEKNDEVLNFSYLKYGRYNKIKPMTKNEALSFVYQTEDTMALYCAEKSFSMDTEEVFGIDTSLYLPDKYFKIERENYFLLCYSSYKCDINNGYPQGFIYLWLIDTNYNITDKLLVYEEKGDWNYISGLLNPKNGKLFVSGRYKSTMYIIDESSLTFKVKKESNEIKDIEYSSHALKDLDWEEYFLE
jgi:hypothetical protein